MKKKERMVTFKAHQEYSKDGNFEVPQDATIDHIEFDEGSFRVIWYIYTGNYIKEVE